MLIPQLQRNSDLKILAQVKHKTKQLNTLLHVQLSFEIWV